jgi:hypothetical protein
MESYNLPKLDENRSQIDSESAFSLGRMVGILLLFQLAAALTLPFIFSKPITLGTPTYLTAVAAHSLQIRLTVLLSFAGSGLTVYLGLTAFKIFRLYSKSAAIFFMVICAISCTLDIVQAGTVLSMLNMSKEFVASGTADSEIYRVAGAAVASARRSAHTVQLLGIGAWMFVFYISLFRFRLVPRVLSAFGLLGVMAQFVGVTLMMLLGQRSIGEMAMPLLPIHITVAIWLIIKGFNHKRV